MEFRWVAWLMDLARLPTRNGGSNATKTAGFRTLLATDARSLLVLGVNWSCVAALFLLTSAKSAISEPTAIGTKPAKNLSLTGDPSRRMRHDASTQGCGAGAA